MRLRSLLFTLTLAGCAGALPPETSDTSNLGNTRCESALFTTIAEQVMSVTGGPIARNDVVTTDNVADSNVLIGGAAIFGKVADLVEAAQHDVAIETWRWDAGADPTLRLLDGLKRLEARRRSAAATTPVVVRLLLNRVTGQTVENLSRVGTAILAQGLDKSLVDVQIVDYFPTWLGANHAKTAIIDGQWAVVMGANMANGYDTSPEWWDSGVVVGGQVAQSLFVDFAGMWSAGQQWLCGAGSARSPVNANETVDGPDPCFDRPSPASTIPATSTAACMPMIVANHPADGLPFPAAQPDTQQAKMFLGAMNNARTLVRVQSPNLNEELMKQAIVDAIHRGVTVQLLLSMGFEQTGESLPGRGGSNDETVIDLFTRVSDVSNACALLQLHWYSVDGLTPVDGTPPPNSHVKYMSVDGQVAIAGSANMDVQSWRNSHEINVLVDSADLTKAWDDNLFLIAWDRSVVEAHCAPNN